MRILAILLFLTAGAVAAEKDLLLAVQKTTRNSEAEARAMEPLLGQSTAPTEEALEAAGRALDLADQAKSPAEFLAAANLFTDAARLTPWIAEYHFQRGRLLVKAGAYPAAERALALYIKSAPQAPNVNEVANLVAGLKRARPTTRHSPGDVFRDCADCPEMVAVPAGAFTMGSPPTEQGRYDAEGPQRRVTVPAFALGKYPVTQEEYALYLRETRTQPEPCDDVMHKMWKVTRDGHVTAPGGADLPRQPAVCLNWHDAQAYVAWLNKHVSALSGAGAHYRLPTEAEWEYAARGATVTARWWGDGVGRNQANCNGCGSPWDNRLIAPVGSFGPNPFGLYDVLGNVWQWTADCWNENYTNAPVDGSAWTAGQCNSRVVRGGSWSNVPVFIRSAMRMRSGDHGQDFDYAGYVGFRVARALN